MVERLAVGGGALVRSSDRRCRLLSMLFVQDQQVVKLQLGSLV